MAKRAIKRKFESPEMTGKTLANDTHKGEKDFQVFVFPSGEMILQARLGECIYLERDQAVELFTFFGGRRVERRMLDATLASLAAAGHGELMEEMLRIADTLTPEQRFQCAQALHA